MKSYGLSTQANSGSKKNHFKSKPPEKLALLLNSYFHTVLIHYITSVQTTIIAHIESSHQ